MKSFLYFILTIFFIICTAITINLIDPESNFSIDSANSFVNVSINSGASNINLNITSATLISLFSGAIFSSLYLFIVSLFIHSNEMNYHRLRAALIGLLIGSLLLLRITGLLTWVVLLIILAIYTLSEITIYELRK
ncbi:MAG: hypothetical protein WCJ19_04875 [bacterium]